MFGALLLWMLLPVAASAATGPGGVAGVTLWYRAADYTGTTWTDKSSAAIVASPPAGAVSPAVIAQDANYNPGVSFDGSTQWLRGTLTVPLASTPFAAAKTYIFVVSNSNVYAPSASAFGNVLSGYNASSGPSQGITYNNGAYGVDTSTGYASGLGLFTVSTPTPILSDVSYPTAGVGTSATITQNGLTSTVSPPGSVTATQQFDIGGRTSNGATSNLFSGSIDEIVYFNNTTLSATQIAQIRSYLALKYGITLGFNPQTNANTGTNYLASDGTTVWTGASTAATYEHDVAGIGRDDTSGFSGLIAHSVDSAASGNTFDVTINNGSSTQSAFPTDKSYMIWGHNGLSTTMSNHTGIYRMDRIWLIQLNKALTSVYFQLPAIAFAATPNPELWVWFGGPTGTPIYHQALICGGGTCTATVPANATGSYYFSFGQVEVAGTVFEDVNYGGGAGRPMSTAGCGCVALNGVRVELYQGASVAAATFVSSTTTASGGTYLFLASPSTSYFVRVVTPTTSSRSGGSTTGLLPVQTYRTSAASGTASGATDRVGGETPGLIDAAANAGATLSSLTTSTTTAQSLTTAVVPALDGILGIDFGFNFDTIVNAATAGQGSFAQFIVNANALGGVSSLAQKNQTAATQTSIFMIGNGSAHAGLHAGSNLLSAAGVATMSLTTALPALSNASTVIDATTETTNDGATNSGTWGTGGTVGTAPTTLSTISKPTVQLVGTSSLATGLSIAASNVTIRGLAISGFGTGGGSSSGEIAVTGGVAGTLIEKNVIGTSASAFSTGNGAGGNGIVAGGSGGTIQNNMLGYMSGIPIALTSTSGWTISGNEIRSAQGSAGYAGLALSSTTSTTLAGNLITGNPASGISTDSGSTTLTIQNNTISGNGISVAGSSPAQTPGIALGGSSNTIAYNIVSTNYGAGILVANGAVSNTISRNSIFSNGTVAAANGATASGEIGIDLQTASDAAGTGSAPYITPNRSGGVGTGGNNILNFPVVAQAAIVAGNLIVSGYARPGTTIELYVADTTPSSGFGQGKTYLTTLTEGAASGTLDTDSTTGAYTNAGGNTHVGTDTTNRFRFSLPVPTGVAVGSVITELAYLAADGSSEFGANVVVGNAVGVPAIATVLSVSDGVPAPGAVITYTGVFTNSGSGQAYSFSIVDPMPAYTDYQIGSAGTDLATSSLTATLQYSNDGGNSWTYVPVSGGGGAAPGYDRTVSAIRFVFAGSLDYVSPNNTGSFSLAVRVR